MSGNGLVSGLFGAMQGTFGSRGVPSSRILTSGTIRANPNATYELMRDFASGNNPYREWAGILTDYGIENVAIQPLRTPVNAVCRVYKGNIWPGTIREDDDDSALPLILPASGKEDNLRAAIHKVWRWSNWNDNKDQSAYDAAMLGDQVFKVRSDRLVKRSWFELNKPDYMTDLDIDGRGYLTLIRIDVPQTRRAWDGKVDEYTLTEVWDKENRRYRMWEHKQGASAGTDQLGTPLLDLDMWRVYGVDFVPFVHWKIDTASDDFRGVPVCMPAIDKIVFGDILTTKLHQRLARESDWALEGVGLDPDGMTLSPPNMDDQGGELVFGNGRVWRFPSGWKLKSLVADMPYGEHRSAIEDHYDALAETDLPEMTWGKITESGTQSGVALRYRMTNAISRLEQARGRAESSLIRVTQMCLSVAQQIGAPGFSAADIGTYDGGDFDFWIADRAIVPLSEGERSEIETARVTRAQALYPISDNPTAAFEAAGYAPDEAAKLAASTGVPIATEL